MDYLLCHLLLFFLSLFFSVFLVVRGKDKVILAASRNFLFVSVVGAILSYASLFMFFFKPTDAFCSAQVISFISPEISLSPGRDEIRVSSAATIDNNFSDLALGLGFCDNVRTFVG